MRRFDARNALIHRLHDGCLRQLAPQYLGGRLLDIGCGIKPYRELLAPFVSEHVGLDHPGTMHSKASIDLFGTAYGIPCSDATFDSALCTAVLEHLEEPESALRECFRVLKPGAHAVYSVPFIWHLHEEPRDFYRFTKYGLEYLFKKAGFEIVEIIPLSGFWTTFSTLASYDLMRYARGPLRWSHALDLLSLVGQGAAWALDLVDGGKQWTWMYMVVARRPLETS